MVLNQKVGQDLIRNTRTERVTAPPATGPLQSGKVNFAPAQDVDIVEFSNGNRLVQQHPAGQAPQSYTVESQGKTEERVGRFEVTHGPSVVIKGSDMEQVIRDNGEVSFKQFGPWGFTHSVTIDCHTEGAQKPHEPCGGSLWLNLVKDSFNSSFIDQAWVDSARPDRLQVNVAGDSAGRPNPHAGEQAEMGLLLPWNVFAPKG